MKKFLISVLALIMGVTLAFGLVACGDEETPEEGGQGEVTMTDAEIAEQAISLVKSLNGSTADNDNGYDVLGQVKVGEGYYKVVWTVTSDTAGIENYVSIGQMDETSKLVHITLTMGDAAVEFKLKATVTVGEASQSAEFAHKLNAKPANAAGTAEDPFSTRRVIEIASGLGTSGTYYYSEADQGAAIPTRVWVEGYIIDCGNSNYFGTDAVGWVYIAENPDSTEDSADALCVYRIEYDDEHLTCFEDLQLGKKIMVNGFIEWYQGKNDSAPYAEIASFRTSSGYESVYCNYLEKEERTPQQSVTLALSKVEDTLTFNQTGDYDLPGSTIPGVTFEWTTTDQTYTITGNKLHIGALPTADTTITATVTATHGTDAVTNNTKDVTITIKAAVTAEAGTAVFDFSGVSEKGDALTDGDATDYFKGFASADSNLTKAEVTKIYKGNASGGAHANTAGLLKAGTSSAAGQIKLTFSKNVKSVVVNCHDWYARSTSNPTNSNTVAVNGSATQLMPYNESGTPDDLTFTLSEETNVITIGINTRGFIYKITVTFGEGTVEPGPGGDTETHVCEDKCPICGKCTSECTDPVCADKCTGHQLATTEFHTTSIPELKGKVSASGNTTTEKFYAIGIVKSIKDAYNSEIYIVDDQNNELYVYGLRSEDGTSVLQTPSDTIHVGDTIVVYGVMTNYSGTIEMQYAWLVQVNTTAKTTAAAVLLAGITVASPVSEDFELPTADGQITWTVTDGSGISVEGGHATVTRTAEDQTVTLTATANVDNKTATKTFTVVVSKQIAGQETLTLNVDTLNVGSSYGNGNAVIGGITFSWAELGDYGNGIQMRTKNSKSSTIYNTQALGKILTVKFVWNGEKAPAKTDQLKVELAADAAFTGAATQYANFTSAGETVTLTLSDQNYTYIRVTHNNQGAVYLDAIEITYSTSNDPQPQEKNDEVKVQEVLDSLHLDTTTFSAVGADADLPTSNEYEANVVWTVKDHAELVEIESNTLTVTALPDETTQVTLHVTVTLNNAKVEKDFQITVNAKEVVPVTTTTVNVSIETYALAHGWQDATTYATVTLDNNVKATVSGTSGNPGYYSESQKEWRLYQSGDSQITFTAENDATIVSVKLTYSSSKGVLAASAGGTTYSSNTVIPVNAASVTFGVSYTGTDGKNNGQVKIKAIEVIYTGGAEYTDEAKLTDALALVTIEETELTENLTLPTTSPISGVTLSWASNKDTVAKVVDGELQITRGEQDEEVTLTLTASINGKNQQKTFTVTVKAAPQDTGNVWTLVTDAGTLQANDQIILVCGDVAMSTTQNKNNRGTAAITNNTDTVTFESEVEIITLVTGSVDGTFGLQVSGGYLYAGSSKENYLKTQSSLDANASWKITISGGEATIVAQGANTRNSLRYNSSSKLFACYASGQAAVSIYKLTKAN